MKYVLTPRDEYTNGRICARCNAERGKVQHVLVVRHHEEEPKGAENQSTLRKSGWWETCKYPTLPRKLNIARVMPRLWIRSVYQAAEFSTIAATAYGGTVKSCAVAFSGADVSDRQKARSI
jgi:hypothetical protein